MNVSSIEPSSIIVGMALAGVRLARLGEVDLLRLFLYRLFLRGVLLPLLALFGRLTEPRALRLGLLDLL